MPERIKGTDLFVETNLNANSIVKICRDALSLFGYADRDFRVEAS